MVLSGGAANLRRDRLKEELLKRRSFMCLLSRDLTRRVIRQPVLKQRVRVREQVL